MVDSHQSIALVVAFALVLALILIFGSRCMITSFYRIKTLIQLVCLGTLYSILLLLLLLHFPLHSFDDCDSNS